MKITGINEVPVDSRDPIATILANDFEQNVMAAILKTPSAEANGLRKVAIEGVVPIGTQYENGDPIGLFFVTIAKPAKKYELNRSIYKVYVVGGKRTTGDVAYFEKDEYVAKGKEE